MLITMVDKYLLGIIKIWYEVWYNSGSISSCVSLNNLDEPKNSSLIIFIFSKIIVDNIGDIRKQPVTC